MARQPRMAHAEGMARERRMAGLVRALRHRNYRLFFAGQAISLVGTWLTRVALSWLVYRLTDSLWLLGIVGFASQAPTFFFAPISGVWIDRLPRQRVLLATQALALLQSALLAYFALTHAMTVPTVIALAAFQGCIDVFDLPARQTFLAEIVEDRADLPNAVALNSSIVNGARLIGPSLAGVLIAWLGEGLCFALDAVSYLAVLGSLLAIRLAHASTPPQHGRVLRQLSEGFGYVARSRPIRALLLLLMTSSLFGMPYTVLMPAVVRNVLGREAGTLGALMAASGAGALLGALYLAARRSVVGLGRIIALAPALFGASLMALSHSRWLLLDLPLMSLGGLAMMVHMAATNTILQTIADESRRGRVMSFYTMAVFGTTPFGSLLAGVLAEHIGVQNTLLIGGGVCLVAALWFARALPELREVVRPIYVQLGILPELEHGVAAATQLTSLPPG
jgi:MFS family permease